MHDLVIRTVAEYFRYGLRYQQTLVKLMALSQRFYNIRDIFISNITLNPDLSEKANENKPYGWNLVHEFVLEFKGDITSKVPQVRNLIPIINRRRHDVPVDLSVFHFCRKIFLYRCREMLDFSPLRNLRRIQISQCDGAVDLSPLNYVHTIIIRHCRRLTDVSSLGLGQVHKLVIMGCFGIQDFSKLGTVHTLCIRDCPGLRDVSKLCSVRKLVLDTCNGVSDVSALGKVRYLCLDSCPISDVSALGGVEELGLFFLHGITDISALKTVKKLTIQSCLNVPNT